MKHTERQNEQSKGLVVITGCDTGIGQSLVKLLSRKGYTVFQSYLAQNPFENESNIYSVKMDLRKPEDVEGFCIAVKARCKEGWPLSAVITNSGIALGGPVENLPMRIYRECFDVNYFGAVQIIQALIPELIQSQGRIIVNGSMAGRIALPFLSPYASSKFALEGFCDSLRCEMKPFGIRTILLEPAAVATPIWNKAKEQDISFVAKKYLSSLNSFRENFVEGGNQGMDVEAAALEIAGILEHPHPKARYIIAKNKLVSRLMLIIPSFVLDKVVNKIFKMNYGSCQGKE